MRDLLNTMPNLAKHNDIHIVACGSVMCAGTIVKSLTGTGARTHVDCMCVGEYRYANLIFTDKTLVILVSQSGETVNTIAALQFAKEHGMDTPAIVGAVGFTITKEVSSVVHTKVGSEICVATTKAYCTQVAALSLITCNLAYIHGNIDTKEAARITGGLKDLLQHIQQLVGSDQYKAFAKKIYEHNGVFLIGHGLDYSLPMEDSLKLKEVPYIHSEAYTTGELKHRTISLIEKRASTAVSATDGDLHEKTINNIREVKACGTYVVLLISDDLDIASGYYDGALVIPKVNRPIQEILTIIPLQMATYEITRLRGCEIDQPRNLAKPVAIE